jgi:SAM-dependent methyltransferase
VRVSQKIQKLFTRDAAESLWEHACRWTHRVSSQRILATIDKAELVRLREDYPYRPNARKINAYEDANYWVGVNVKRIQDLWLDRSPPLEILDLGCGPGYFLYLCRLFGHEALGLDPDDEPFFRGTTKFFGVSRVVARINAQVPLPDLGKKFDLVTAHRVCFHRIARRENGEFNRRADGSSFFTPELRAFFESQGARIVRWKALLAANPNQRARFKRL